MSAISQNDKIVSRIGETLANLPLTPIQCDLIRGIGSPQKYQQWCRRSENYFPATACLADTIANYRSAVWRVRDNNNLADHFIGLAVEGAVAAVGRQAKGHIEAGKVMAAAKSFIQDGK